LGKRTPRVHRRQFTQSVTKPEVYCSNMCMQFVLIHFNQRLHEFCELLSQSRRMNSGTNVGFSGQYPALSSFFCDLEAV
jgi:hypothetical protein